METINFFLATILLEGAVVGRGNCFQAGLSELAKVLLTIERLRKHATQLETIRSRIVDYKVNVPRGSQ